MKSAFSVRRGVGIWSCMLAVVLSGIAGCATAPPKAVTVQEVPVPAADVGEQADENLWKEGMRAFEQGDYGKARGIFEILGRNSHSETIGRRALYALAAVRLTMAQTPDEYGEAVALWERWGRQLPSPVGGEDPRMLTPFLMHVSPPGLAEAQAALGKKPPREQSETNIGAYKNLLQAREKDVDNLRAKLEAKDKEIRRLRHQLESVEEIHRKYQEKKQEASAP